MKIANFMNKVYQKVKCKINIALQRIKSQIEDKNTPGETSKNKISPVWTSLLLFFLVVFIISAVMFLREVIIAKHEQSAFQQLALRVEVANSAKNSVENNRFQKTMEEQEGQEDREETLPQYTEYLTVYEENHDFAGWLCIDNTGIDYPIMCTPDEPEYYLYRAFDKSESQSGTPFIGADSTADSDMFIIHGHNMKNGTMFGTLKKYAEKSFWEENPTFLFTTITEKREYEIFSAIKTHVLYQNEPGYRWYYHAGDLSEEDFDELTDYLVENSLYDTGIVPVYGEQIIILSTCAYHTENGRFIVAARRVLD